MQTTETKQQNDVYIHIYMYMNVCIDLSLYIYKYTWYICTIYVCIYIPKYCLAPIHYDSAGLARTAWRAVCKCNMCQMLPILSLWPAFSHPQS